MKLSYIWNPASLLQSPLLRPLHPVITRLNQGYFPTLHDFNELLAGLEQPVGVQQGHNLHFVPQESGKIGFESQYEPRCYLTGEVQTRPENWHDFFNALVWFTFPKAKAAINTRHYRALAHELDANSSQRGRVRDMATLLDESGVIVVSANSALAELLKTFQWKELFWHRRKELHGAMDFYIFGHGLYEKSLQPYIGMTGQGLILNVEAEFFAWTHEMQLSYLDTKVAEYLNNPEHCLNPRELHPVPLLGLPGWSADNEREAYYDNTSYFRSHRRNPK